MSHGLVLNQYCVHLSQELSDILRVPQWSYGVNLSGRDGSAIATQEIRRMLTEFPMTRTRLLKVWCSKAGKASTERTGHLGAVDLML